MTNTKNMHGNIPYMFDYWADPVVHLFILKSSMDKLIPNSCKNNCELSGTKWTAITTVALTRRT